MRQIGPKTYVVETSKYGEFPLDMLRHDDAQAATPEDAALIERLNDYMGDGKKDLPKKVRVTLKTDSRHAPNIARWESFGCKVVECSDPLHLKMHQITSIARAADDEAEFIKRNAQRDADEISARIYAGGYRGNLSDVECLRNHVRKLLKLLEPTHD